MIIFFSSLSCSSPLVLHRQRQQGVVGVCREYLYEGYEQTSPFAVPFRVLSAFLPCVVLPQDVAVIQLVSCSALLAKITTC